jgi:UPF0755 protein
MKRFLVKAAVVAAVLLAAVLIYFDWMSRPPGSGRIVTFTVERGWGVREICDALTDSGLVRNPLYALWRFRRMGEGVSLQAGTYLLDDGMTADSILSLIAAGSVIPEPTGWVTLPPGLTLEQSLDRISSSLGMDRGVLDSLAADTGFTGSLGVPCLEGYLFPETYEFALDESPGGVIARMVRTGLERIDGTFGGVPPGTGLDMHRTVILASIVEREAMLDSERQLVAGVFLLRLRRGMRLESCATVQYALGEVKEHLLYSDLRVDSPYNTYLHGGLPPGPICSPGLPSIEAAYSPDTTQGYLYFVSREDGTGGHLFATTHSGHLENRRRVGQGLQ